MRGLDGNETCPNCYQVMIELNRFDARDDAIQVDKGGWSGGGRSWWEFNWDFEIAGRLWDKIRASFYQWRLHRVLRRWPYSLYCSGCGYIVKRQ